jgi:transcriptional regulator with XRE-family HTH domain
MNGERVGSRVSAIRTARGITQRRLAQDAHISYSLLTKLERGHAPATPAVIGALARALRVDIPRLTGQPYEAASATSEQIYQPITLLRRQLLAYDVAMPPNVPPRDLDQISADVATMSQLRRATSFRKLAAALPPLVEELQFLTLTETGQPREQALRLLAETYYGVECLGSGVGYQDVYLLAIERFTWCAQQLADPLLIAAAKWGRAGPLMREGGYEAGLQLLARARQDLEGGGAETLAMAGSLHLRESLLAARLQDADEAWAHIDEAREIAARVGETNLYELAFGPSNAIVYAVAVGVDLGDGVRAVRAGVEHRGPLAVPAERVGHHYIDLARAYLLIGNRGLALQCLQQARRAAPQQTRHHPQARETVLAIASSTRGSEELSSFAAWLGIS